LAQLVQLVVLCLDFWVGDMNELFAQLFGQQPGYATALLGEDEAARLQRQAQQQGLLNVGLSLLAGSGPSPQRRGIGQLLAQGVAAGQQAYQGAYDKAVRDRMLQEQIMERQQARLEQQMAQQILPQIYRPGAAMPTFYGQQTQMPLRDDEGNLMPGAGMTIGQPQIDMAALQQLLARAPGVAMKVIPAIENIRKLTAPERIKLGAEESLTEITPEGEARLVARGVGKPKEQKFTDIDAGNVIIRYQDGVEIGRIPKGLAPERPVSLQPIETEGGYIVFNPRTGKMEPLMQDGQPVMGKGIKPTTDETNAAGFASRMVLASSVLSKTSGSERPGYVESITKAIPLIGDKIPAVIPDKVGGLSPDRQRYLQAANNWIRANLRKESGAAIGVDEWAEEYKNYFPQVGDSEDTIRQKEQFRRVVTNNMIRAGGKSFKIPDQLGDEEDLYKKYGLTKR